MSLVAIVRLSLTDSEIVDPNHGNNIFGRVTGYRRWGASIEKDAPPKPSKKSHYPNPPSSTSHPFQPRRTVSPSPSQQPLSAPNSSCPFASNHLNSQRLLLSLSLPRPPSAPRLRHCCRPASGQHQEWSLSQLPNQKVQYSIMADLDLLRKIQDSVSLSWVE
ncbi:uncharacterized protein LOC130963620 [Arachis stenosperma]|uniref:uncharacterized protein LOC130963620 n=1 Tax=Arachis stenosperma TaxID=217475 RepID=UPI0025AD2948|nr:uncharacterized protein LOC130963620 [Arachis stenosperma]